MKRMIATLCLVLLACVPAFAGVMYPDYVPPPPCDPSIEVCPLPANDSDVLTTVVLLTLVPLIP